MGDSNLNRLIYPKSIVVVGNKGADSAIRESLGMGFDGSVWSVHPSKKSIEGIDCYKSIKDLPSPPDAAFIAVNAESAITAIKELNEIGCGGAVVYASGFEEIGKEGVNRNKKITKAAKGMPIIGPNCYGFINSLDRVALWPDVHGCRVIDKGVAIITQSGNIGLNMTMQSVGLPIAFMFTVGNQANTNIANIIDVMLDDERVCAIGLHIESIKEINGFDIVARRSLKRKIPIVAIKTGRTETSTQIALSHTSSLTGSDQLFDIYFKRLGIARVDTVPEFLETLKLLSIIGPITTNRVASMSCSGGEAGMMADLIDGLDVHFPVLDDEHKNSIKSTLNDFVEVENPLDYHTFIWGDRDRTSACFKEMLKGKFGATMLLLDWPKGDNSDQHEWDTTYEALFDAVTATGEKAIVLASIADCMPKRIINKAISHGIAPMIGLDTCLKALHYAYRFAESIKSESIKSVKAINRINYTSKNQKIISEYEGKKLLSKYGLNTPDGGIANNTVQAIEISEKIQYPVVVKVLDEKLIHKSEHGAVKLNIENSEMLVIASNDLLKIGPSLLVERMIEGVIAEMIIGIDYDPLFGNYLVIGSGGVLVELVNDSAQLLFPIEREDVFNAISELKVYSLINGYRGNSIGDIDAVIDTVMSVVNFVNDNEVVELDINPLLVLPKGKGVIAVDVLVKLNT
jgi:acetyl-CoA synthetase